MSPSGEKAMENTVASCSVMVRTRCPVLRSQRHTACVTTVYMKEDEWRKCLTSSSPAEASTEAPGQKAAVLTAAPLGWTRLASCDPVPASQRREVPSVEAEQSRVPPGDNDTTLTLYL